MEDEKTFWEVAQQGEREWWGDCRNTYFEEEKQLKYAEKMGLQRTGNSQTPYIFDMEGRSVLDIGGGPASILLKCQNVQALIIDPLEFPPWIQARYKVAGIEYRQGKGEDIDLTGFDEVWIYNVLQHADDPEKIIQNAKKAGRLIRIFEWVDTPPNPMHPHELKAVELDSWLGGKGTVEETTGGRLPAKMYYGQFKGASTSSAVAEDRDQEMKVHFVTTGPDFPYTYYLGIMSAMKVYGDRVQLWYTEEPDSVYFDILRDKVKIEKVEDLPVFPALVDKDLHLQRVSIFDYTVWNAVYNHGGIIMGLDSLTLRSHFDLLHPDKEMLAPIDSPGTLFVGMHGVIVRKGSALAKTIIDQAIVSLSDPHKEIKWGDAGMTPYVHSIPSNLDKVSLAPFKMVCGRYPDLFKADGDMPVDSTRTIPLYASSSNHDMKIDEAYIEKSHSPYAKLVKEMLSPEEWKPNLAQEKIQEVGSDVAVELGDIKGHVASRHKRFHLLGLPHVATNKNEGLACAFSQKVIKMAQMLKSLGHTVYFYGVEGSTVECDEYIQVSTQEILKQAYGDYDMTKVTYKHASGDIAYTTFNDNAITEIQKRMQPNDFLLIPFSPDRYKAIIDAFNTTYIDKDDKLHLIVEMGIGYRGTRCAYRVFESVSQRHYCYGLEGQKDGRWYDAVIPNYFDPDDFEYSDSKSDYFLFLGRVIHRKGIAVAVATVEAIGGKLIVAGQSGNEGVDLSSPNVEYVGFADIDKRKELLKNAKALILPTQYIEPFGGVIIEAAFSGTPVITTDWGAFPELVHQGKTGYRCSTLREFVEAAKNIGHIDPYYCYQYAMGNFSLDVVRWMYEVYFNRLLDVIENIDGKAWHRLHSERDNLDWLFKDR